MRKNQKIAQALNCVSKADHYFPMLEDRIFSRKVGFAGEFFEVDPGKAVLELEIRIKEMQIKLQQAEATLKEIRSQAVDEAEEALVRASGD